MAGRRLDLPRHRTSLSISRRIPLSSTTLCRAAAVSAACSEGPKEGNTCMIEKTFAADGLINNDELINHDRHAAARRRRVVVTGGAGFLGSHLCDALINRGDEVICVDNLASGSRDNIRHLEPSPQFLFSLHDIRYPIDVQGPVDVVANLASLASPPGYLRRPIFTLTTGADGTRNALDLARRKGARFVQASTSEVYGDPSVHPQVEEYWGNVNPVGPRSVYDEAKRYAEALITAYRKAYRVNTGIFRIFNTYGPRMHPDDGRVVTNFIKQALNDQPLTVYGDGSQTRSLCYVDDLIRGIVAMIDSTATGPINLGNPHEVTIRQIAEIVLELTDSTATITTKPLPVDDPTRRRPDITRAVAQLNWSPSVTLSDGLARTIEWHRATRVGEEQNVFVA